MTEERPKPPSFNAVIKPITDIAGTVTALLAYVAAIFEIGDLPYSKTTSVLTVLLTSILVVNWRWHNINFKKKKTTAKTNGKNEAKKSLWDKLAEPIRKSDRDTYVLGVTRRRVETSMLAGIILFTVVWMGINLSAVYAEWTGESELVCNGPRTDGQLRVVVADLLQTNSDTQLLISPRIYDTLVEQSTENTSQVCRLKQTIENVTVARSMVDKYRADLLIWGRSDVIYEFHLEAPGLEDPHRKLSELSTAEAASVQFLLREPGHIAFLTEFALGEILMLQNKPESARMQLQSAINRSEVFEILDEDKAKAYFLLGLTYDPNYYLVQDPDAEKAIEAYSDAILADSGLYSARLNRGVLLMYNGRDEEALQDFDFLIEEDTPLKSSALINRASIISISDPEAALKDLDEAIKINPVEGYFFRGTVRVNTGDYPGAIEDFKKAVEYDPGGFYNYHLLGQSQLYAGEYTDAKQTYTDIIPTLTEETREQVITELENDAVYTPEIKPVVDEIIRALRSASLP